MTTVSNEPSPRATLLRAALTAPLQPSADEYAVERTGAVPEALLDAALTLRATTCDEPIGRNGRLYLRRWHLTTRDKLNGQRVYLHEFCPDLASELYRRRDGRVRCPNGRPRRRALPRFMGPASSARDAPKTTPRG